MKKLLIGLVLLSVLLMGCLSAGEKVLVDSYKDIVTYKTEKVFIEDFFYVKAIDLYVWEAKLWEKISEQWMPVTCYMRCPPPDKRLLLETKTMRLEVTVEFNTFTYEIKYYPCWIVTTKDAKFDHIDLSTDTTLPESGNIIPFMGI